MNNYGVWEDEFKELGLRDTLEYIWPDALCYFGEDKEVRPSLGCYCRRSPLPPPRCRRRCCCEVKSLPAHGS